MNSTNAHSRLYVESFIVLFRFETSCFNLLPSKTYGNLYSNTNEKVTEISIQLLKGKLAELYR